MSLNVPLKPRKGVTLRVIAVCRISTEHQDAKSLDDQEALLRKYISEHYAGPTEWKPIKTRGSGEYLDRVELLELEESIASGEYDVVIAEDLSRYCRRIHAIAICEACEDSQTRLIAINDRVDTIDSGWRDNAMMSAWHHERSNRDTSDRIQRSLKNKLICGEALERLPYGYIRPPGATSDTEIEKDPAAEVVYDRWFAMLEQGASYSDVADWLNGSGVPVGPYSRNKKWDGRMVGRVTHNAKLKGVREGSRHKAVRVNKTGRRKSVKTEPEEWIDRYCPNMTFIDPERYDRVIAMLKERNAHYSRIGVDGRHPRKGIPKKRTRFPGQMVYCGVCGRMYVYGGHGQKAALMCDGARAHQCWNGATVNQLLATEKIVEAVMQAIQDLPEFDETLLAEVRQEIEQLESRIPDERARCLQHIEKLERELANFLNFIREGKASHVIQEEIVHLESALLEQRNNLKRLQKPAPAKLSLPSIDDLKRLAIESLKEHATESWEFRTLMEKLIPRITVFPYQLCDVGAIVLRGRFDLRLGNLLDNSFVKQVLDEPLVQHLEVDLFVPPQREFYRSQIVALRTRSADGRRLTEKQVAKQLGLTVTATQRAATLQRMMDARGIADPYMALTEPPAESKIKRHLHPRYEFTPLPHAGVY